MLGVDAVGAFAAIDGEVKLWSAGLDSVVH